MDSRAPSAILARVSKAGGEEQQWVQEALAMAADALFDQDPRRATALLTGVLARLGKTPVSLRAGVRLRRLLAAAARATGERDELLRAVMLLEGGLPGTEGAPALAAALWLDLGRSLSALDSDEDALIAFAQPAKLMAPALLIVRADQEHARLRARREGPSHPDVPRLIASARQRCVRSEGEHHPLCVGVALFGHLHQLPLATWALGEAAKSAPPSLRPALDAAIAKDLAAAHALLARRQDPPAYALLTALLQAEGRFEEADVADARR